jgi:hypothetical protein
MTGLSDPLSRMTRHELEQAFSAFAVVRDRHLGQLLAAANKARMNIDAIVAAAPAPAQHVMRRAHFRR